MRFNPAILLVVAIIAVLPTGHGQPVRPRERVYEGKVVDPPVPRVAQSDTSDLQVQLATADASLNKAYQRCLAAFPHPSKEQLRIAQRAWIVFTNKEEAAAELAGTRRGLTTDDLERKGLDELIARAEQLTSFFTLERPMHRACACRLSSH